MPAPKKANREAPTREARQPPSADVPTQSADAQVRTPGATKAKPSDIAIPNQGGRERGSPNLRDNNRTNRGPITSGSSSPMVQYGETRVPSGFGATGRRAVQGIKATDERSTDGRPYHQPGIVPEVDEESGLTPDERQKRRDERGAQDNEPKPIEDADEE